MSITKADAARRFEEAARSTPPMPPFEGKGIVMAAGGPFVPSAYVAVRLLRRDGVRLPIEIWHAGEDEFPEWARRAFAPWNVSLRDVMPCCPGRPQSELRGWPIKPEALLHSSFRHVLFLDADCFPLRNPEMLLDSPEYAEYGALFWPDNRYHRMVSGAAIWELTGLPFRGDPEFETGIFALDKQACWRELCLARWMNAHSSFWYDYVLGDKDTFYLAWRKLGRRFFLAPPCRRYQAVVTRHFWTDGAPIVDHRTGSSKYGLPRRKGPFRVHLTPYKYRPSFKNLYDELMQHFFVKEFRTHVGYLEELGAIHDEHLALEQARNARKAPAVG